MLSRRSRRSFRTVSDEELSLFFWHTCKTIRTQPRQKSRSWESRPLPSAGGCHPIEVIVMGAVGTAPACSVYEPKSHSLAEMPNQIPTAHIRREIGKVLDPQEGTACIFAADRARTDCRYEHPESLIWRDAGILIGGMAVVAEALGMSFCPLGITGTKILPMLLGPDTNYYGAGGFVIGGKHIDDAANAGRDLALDE
ncbi:MAG TPA: nitroreductase family protein [Verrucomicrobiales bacterium]|nr:nitroreductase family protein [Verrucomicrobiales bacterium]